MAELPEEASSTDGEISGYSIDYIIGAHLSYSLCSAVSSSGPYVAKRALQYAGWHRPGCVAHRDG